MKNQMFVEDTEQEKAPITEPPVDGVQEMPESEPVVEEDNDDDDDDDVDDEDEKEDNG